MSANPRLTPKLKNRPKIHSTGLWCSNSHYSKIWLNTKDLWAAMSQEFPLQCFWWTFFLGRYRVLGRAASEWPHVSDLKFLSPVKCISIGQNTIRISALFQALRHHWVERIHILLFPEKHFLKFFHRNRILVNFVASTPAQRLTQSECSVHVCWVSEQIVLKVNRPIYLLLGQKNMSCTMSFNECSLIVKIGEWEPMLTSQSHVKILKFTFTCFLLINAHTGDFQLQYH